MARKNKAPAREEVRPASEYYKLNTKAVEDLVTADESNSPEVSEEELRKYRSGPKLKLTDWAKAILVKMWFAGSVCFFIFCHQVVDYLIISGAGPFSYFHSSDGFINMSNFVVLSSFQWLILIWMYFVWFNK